MKNLVKSALLATALVAGAAVPAMAQQQCGVIVFFPSGQNALGPSAGSAVRSFAAANAGASFTVTGYSDAPGSAAANLALSQRRAQSVAAAVSPPATVTSVQGGGEAVRPGTSGPNDPANRRVEVVNNACPGGLYATTTTTPGGAPFAGNGLAIAGGVGLLGVAAALVNNDSSSGTTGTPFGGN